MKRCRNIAIVVFSACGIGIAFWTIGGWRAFVEQDVPHHKGEPVPKLVNRAVMGNGGVRPDYDLVNGIGAEAVPYLIDWLDYQDPLPRTIWRGLWPKIPDWLKRRPWQPPIFDEDELRENAFELLEELGEKAKPAVPVLRKMLSEGKQQADAVELLGAIGPPASKAMPELKRLVEERDLKAVDALEDIGPKAKAAVPELRAYLEEAADPITRIKLARALYSINGSVDTAYSVFTSALDSEDPLTKEQALFALEIIDERSDEAMTIFLEHLPEDHPEVFGAAVGGLIEAGDLKPSVPVKKAEEQLVKALRDRATPGDFLAPYVLGLLATKSEGPTSEAVSVLKAITDNPRASENTREFAVKALRRIGEEERLSHRR